MSRTPNENESDTDREDTAMSVTAADGFRAAGVPAGIKVSGTRDLALVVNDGPTKAAAGVFTRNQVKAAPVLWSAQVLAGRRLRAVVLNSGGANACTGHVQPTTRGDARWSKLAETNITATCAGNIAPL